MELGMDPLVSCAGGTTVVKSIGLQTEMLGDELLSEDMDSQVVSKPAAASQIMKVAIGHRVSEGGPGEFWIDHFNTGRSQRPLLIEFKT